MSTPPSSERLQGDPPLAAAPKFSVVIPLYNKEGFIRRTVGSVLDQSFRDFELLVVNDGSTDSSLTRLQEVDDPRLRIVNQDNAGVGAARNRGLAESRGSWIALLDADDYWFPDHLEELSNLIEAVPDAGMVATAYLEGEDPSAPPPLAEQPRRRRVDYFKEAARRIGVICSTNVALRSEVCRTIGEFGPYRAGEDLDYWTRMALAAPVALSSRVTAYYLRSAHGAMAQMERSRGEIPVPASLSDIWPSVAAIETAKRVPDYAHRRRSMDSYQRSAVYITAKVLLAAGQVAGARQAVRLRPGRAFDRAAILALALRAPAPLLSLALKMKRSLRA